jgi:hypothetical protein
MRKPIQIAVSNEANTGDVLYALCDDGTIWALQVEARFGQDWKTVRAIPQEASLDDKNPKTPRRKQLNKDDDPRKQEYLETLQQDHTWPYLDMICLVNTNNGDTAVLKYENGSYVLIPNVHPNHPFDVPENARRGKKGFLEALVKEGWKPD